MSQEAGMDPTRFDRLAITFGQRITRRAVVGLKAALGVTGLVPEEAGAARCAKLGAHCSNAHPERLLSMRGGVFNRVQHHAGRRFGVEF
jgi:hypothetical protein